MQKMRCISKGNLPPRLPFAATAAIWLLVDRYDVPGLWRGVILAVGAVWWFLVAVAWWVYEPVDLLKDKK
jgi:hypothetical protein